MNDMKSNVDNKVEDGVVQTNASGGIRRRAKRTDLKNEVIVGSFDDIRKEELEAMASRARKISDRQLAEAPNITANINTLVHREDPMAALVSYARRRGIITDDMEGLFTHVSDQKTSINNGCIPVIEDGEQLAYIDMLLYMRPKKLREVEEKTSAYESQSRLEQHLVKAQNTILDVKDPQEEKRNV